MTNLITGKMLYATKGNTYNTNTEFDIGRAQKHVLNNVEPTSDNTLSKKPKTKASKVICQTGLMGAGAVLMYLGLKTPSKMRIFRNGVKNRIFQMENTVVFFDNKVKRIVSEAFPKSKQMLEDYVGRKFIKPDEFIETFNDIAAPKRILLRQRKIFKDINATMHGEYRGGASEFDVMVNSVQIERNMAASQIMCEAQQSRLNLQDFTHIPSFSDGKHEDLIVEARAQLAARKDLLYKNYFDNVNMSALDRQTNIELSKVVDVYDECYKSSVDSKKRILDVAFDKMRKILNLGDDFVPSYGTKIYDIKAFDRLPSKDLAPTVVPKRILSAHPNNVYLQALGDIDFNKISRSDIQEIFANITQKDNLTELKFLIDELRLEKVVAKNQSKPAAKIPYNTMIEKLKFLSNELQFVGGNHLYQKCLESFDTALTNATGQKVHNVYDIAKKLGCSTIRELEQYLTHIYGLDNKIHLHDYLAKFVG